MAQFITGRRPAPTVSASKILTSSSAVNNGGASKLADILGGGHHSVSSSRQQQAQQLACVLLKTRAGTPDQKYSRSILQFAQTLSSTRRLGLMPIVLLDQRLEDHFNNSYTMQQVSASMYKSSMQVVHAIEACGGRAISFNSGIFDEHSEEQPLDFKSTTKTTYPQVHLDPIRSALRLQQIPIITPMLHLHSINRYTAMEPSDAFVALTQSIFEETSLNDPVRVFIINERGGLSTYNNTPLKFINLSDEYDGLAKMYEGSGSGGDSPIAAAAIIQTQPLAPLRPLSVFAKPASLSSTSRLMLSNIPHTFSSSSSRHSTPQHYVKPDLASQKQDLDLVKRLLSILPASSSAIIASPQSSSSLINNLITDRPPSGSTSSAAVTTKGSTGNLMPKSSSSSLFWPPTTIRRGLPVTIHSGPLGYFFQSGSHANDVEKLRILLESSFGRPLDTEAFWARLSRVGDCIIVAGDYEGAAIITREKDDVFYLDKFAVAPTAQGIGVADILWKYILKTYGNLSWRSRTANPVNKW